MSIPDLYATYTLDCVVEAAHAIAFDFVKRPAQYAAVDAKAVAPVLADFKVLPGKNPDWPDRDQRAVIYGAVFGTAVGTAALGAGGDQFQQASEAVRNAATHFARRVYDTGVVMLRQAFKDAVVTLQAYLTTLKGATLDRGHAQTQNIFKQAMEVLRDKGVAQAFGREPAPPAPWPIGNYDGKGAYLLEEISRSLSVQTPGGINRQRLLVLQRLAFYGGSTLAEVLNYDAKKWDDAKVDAVMTTAYSWATAQEELGG